MTQFLDAWRKIPARQGEGDADSIGKRERTRRRLLGFAMQCFQKRGYADTTMLDIAAAAGVSRATVFSHFATKAALLGEMSRETAEIWAALPNPEGESGAQAIERFVHFLFRETESGALGVAILRDFVETYGDDMRPGSGMGTLHAHAEAMILRAQVEGDWQDRWPASALAHYLLSSFTQFQSQQGDTFDEEVSAEFLALIGGGVLVAERKLPA